MIIQRDKSIIPACDVDLKIFGKIIKETADIEGVGAYKIPATAGRRGWESWVETARQFTNKPLIYDHQKAGTDIPDTGKDFMYELKESGFDAVILFPQSGPITEYEWIKAAQEQGLGVIVGGEMTHPRYLSGDKRNGKDKDYTQIFKELGIERPFGTIDGFIRESAPEDMYELAARMGVTDFVMPGNKPDKIRHYKNIVELCGIKDSAIYSPGLIVQGGEVSEGAKAAGKRFHGIVGRGIYSAENIRQAALDLTSQL